MTKATCLECGESCIQVPAQTIKHHLKQPWFWDDGGVDYYFCASQDCDTVYFALDEHKIITQGQLRTQVGIKSKAEDAMVCYCFDVCRQDARNKDIKAYVVAQTKAGQCACSIRNPSGRCCLKDFPI